MTEYSGPPVVVIGAGPVGQTAALSLARWGIPVLLLDERMGRSTAGSRAICQQGDVLDIWDSIGAGQMITSEGLTWSTSVTHFRDQELFRVEYSQPEDSAFPPFVNISQHRTEHALDERIRASALIEMRWGHRVVDLVQTAEAVTVTAEAPDGAVVINAPFVMVCAGSRAGALRDKLAVTFDGESFGDFFLICDIRAQLPEWTNERHFYFDPPWNPGRQVLVHPCPDDTFRIDWQVDENFDLDEASRSGALDQRIRQIVGDTEYDVTWKSIYRFQSRCVSRMSVGRVLLVGDAAHLVAPFGGRGLNSGVPDAENGAWKIAFVLRGWSDASIIESYDLERRAAALENIDVTTATMRFLVPRTDEEWTWRMQLLESAVREPTMREHVDSGRLAEPFWYVDSPLSTPDTTRPAASRPPRGERPSPGVGVLLPDERTADGRRLRDAARGGLLIIADDSSASLLRRFTWPADLPLTVLASRDLAPTTTTRLGMRQGEVWIVRPDAHVAAILPNAEIGGIVNAARRLLREVVPIGEDAGTTVGAGAPSSA